MAGIMDELLGLGYASGLNGEVPLNGILSGALAMPKVPAGTYNFKDYFVFHKNIDVVC